MPDIRNGIEFSVKELSTAMTRCFEEYVIPMNVSAEVLAEVIRTEAVDLEASRFAVEDGEIIGLLLLSRRSRTSRISGMAVSPKHRGRQIGTLLIEEVIGGARSRFDESIEVEAIETNSRAIEFYKRFGFAYETQLIGGIYKDCVPELEYPLQECSTLEVAGDIRKQFNRRLVWTVDASTVENMSTPIAGYRCAGASGVVLVSAERIVVDGLAFDTHLFSSPLNHLFHQLCARFPNRTLQIPPCFPEDVYREAFVSSGVEIGSLTQGLFRLRLYSAA